MFDKILIANRGEIACRIIETARKLGIASVAVWSQADSGARHVRLAGEAVCIGPPRAADSYLKIENIIAAARKTGAQAIHPGYGFLSENANFAQAVREAGLVFVGPNPEAIRVMGDKIRSKKLAQNAGVATIPGHPEALEDAQAAAQIAGQIGFPVMIKAAAGGGGKGMRIAFAGSDLAREAQAAAREAEAAFGDGRIFIEKFIERPRHIEIQILCDRHGNGVHLGERECSIQRRNQKVIEESPSPFLKPEVREEMGRQALALARAVSYDSAGTVEFVVDPDQNFYFLEMNTRLQVEHPVTEAVYGVDLVEEMLRIADGEPLRLQQQKLAPRGWAIEARIYAEDPARGFLPSTGRLTRFRPPKTGAEGQKIRLDSGVEEGDAIPVFYDPMIAKLIAHGAARPQAAAAISEALERFEIEGVENNLLFLSAVVSHQAYGKGETTTDFIARHFGETFKAPGPEDHTRAAFLSAALFAHLAEWRAACFAASGPVLRPAPPSRLAVLLDAEKHEALCRLEGERLHIESGGRRFTVESDWRPGLRLFEGRINGEAFVLQIARRVAGWTLRHCGARCLAVVREAALAALGDCLPPPLAREGLRELRCPMPGQVTEVHVAAGQQVRAGEALVSVEAMKMENILRAESDAEIQEVLCKPGDTLALGDPILRFA